ncbi:hypothetical protein OAZ88_00620 [bacterium]|nr:hypothetical protein [bacterium]
MDMACLIKRATRKPLSCVNNSLDSLIRLKIRRDLLRGSRNSLLAAKDACKGRVVFCIGNGPSLCSKQLKLASAHPFIATNRAYQLFSPSLFRRGGQGWLLINDFHRSLEVLPALEDDHQQIVVGCHNPKNIYLYAAIMRQAWIFANCAWGARFGLGGLRLFDQSFVQLCTDDFSKRYYAGWSVIFSAIQFAAYLGAKKIVLFGCDMDFSGPVQYSGLIKNDRLSIGHLGSFIYEENGKPHMIACRDKLQAKGIQMFNAAPAGAITEIPRITHGELEKMLELENDQFSPGLAGQ